MTRLGDGGMRRDEVQAWLVRRIAGLAQVRPQDVDVRAPFSTFGIDSVTALGLVGELEDLLGHSLSVTLIWDYPNIDALASHLASVAAAGSGTSAA